MEPVKLFDSELKLMEILWEKGPLTAKEVSLIATREIGWNKNTTYTVLTKLVQKGALKRVEPDFLCQPLVSRDEVAETETRRLIDKLYDGSPAAFLTSFLQKEKLSERERKELRDIIDRGFGGES